MTVKVALCEESMCTYGRRVIAVAIKDIITGKQMWWLQTVWDQEHIRPSHHPLEMSELMDLNELVQKVWTNIMKMGSMEKTHESSQMMTTRHSPQWFVRLLDKSDEGSPQWAIERKVTTQKGVRTLIRTLVMKAGAYCGEITFTIGWLGNAHEKAE